ncbi:hypothetical protein [Pseudomonas chlororaphis]|uniref:hypothetical protein n=1 Tax=Pseudomonas chlororaphis TaxID=587753 RepID=UPI0014726C14|nr:hypothetical protein [Pseudomonas chlororaphis]NNB41719.1 hypothetical protein [Pseudomonas chlororaphis]
MTITKYAGRGAVFLVALSVISACTSIQLVSKYDEVIDKQTQELQKKLDKHLTFLRFSSEDPLKYESNQKFYTDTLSDLNAISVRASAIYKNKLTIQQVELAKQNLAWLVLLNKRCIDRELTPEQKEKVNKNGVDLSMDCKAESGATKDEPSRGAQKLKRSFLEPVQNMFNQNFGAIMALELAKKRGDGNDEESK